MAGADGKNHLGSHCYNPKRENSSLKPDNSNGGEDKWVNSRDIWKMESTRHDGLVAGATPREMHLWMFAREFYLCMYKNNLIQKIPRHVSTFSLTPSILHVNEYTGKCYLKFQRVKKKLTLTLILKALTDQCIMVTLRWRWWISMVFQCLVTGFVPDCPLKEVCIVYSLEK